MNVREYAPPFGRRFVIRFARANYGYPTQSALPGVGPAIMLGLWTGQALPCFVSVNMGNVVGVDQVVYRSGRTLVNNVLFIFEGSRTAGVTAERLLVHCWVNYHEGFSPPVNDYFYYVGELSGA